MTRTLDFVLSPLTWVLCLIVASLVVRNRLPRLVLGVSASALLYVCSTELVSNALFRWVERPLLNTHKPNVVYDFVVVLGGLEDEQVFDETGEHQYNDNVERLIVAFDLLRQGRASRAILSGARASPGKGMSEAELLRHKLVDWGIAPDRLLVETESTNTWENALFSKRIIEREKGRHVLVITSAFHMRRAHAAFRKVGVDCDALAVDVRGRPLTFSLAALVPRAKALLQTSSAIHELFARGLYHLRGRA